MKQLLKISIIILVLLSTLNADSDQASTPEDSKGKVVIVDKKTGLGPGRFAVDPNGETIITSDSQKANIRVIFKTHEEPIGPHSEKPEEITNSCTYTRRPCSILDTLKININEKRINVPRCSYCDLADINDAEIKIEDNKFILILNGGEASGSYTAKIEFTETRTTGRAIFAGEFHDVMLEETNYPHVIHDYEEEPTPDDGTRQN